MKKYFLNSRFGNSRFILTKQRITPLKNYRTELRMAHPKNYRTKPRMASLKITEPRMTPPKNYRTEILGSVRLTENYRNRSNASKYHNSNDSIINNKKNKKLEKKIESIQRFTILNCMKNL